jgi:hypothetical protein
MKAAPIANGWYRVTGPQCAGYRNDLELTFVTNGHTHDGADVRTLIEYGYTFEPAVVMTKAEFDAAIAEAVMAASVSKVSA